MSHGSLYAHKLCQMHSNLFCSSQTIKFCTALSRLLQRHRYTNSIPKPSLSHWVMRRENLNKFTCSWIIKLLDLEEECLFLYPLLTSFPVSPRSASPDSIYLAFCCLLLNSRHICTFIFVSLQAKALLPLSVGLFVFLSGSFLYISHALTDIRWTIKLFD